MTIVILCRGNCSLSECISTYMVAMAAGDLLVILINVMIYYVFSYHFPHSFLSHTPVCKFIIYMTVITFELSVWFTVSFTFDRFVIICCPKFKRIYCTKRTAVMVMMIFSTMIFTKNIPVLFAYEPELIINNFQWGCLANLVYFSSPFGVACSWFHSVWCIWFTFTLIILFNSLTVRQILVTSRARRALRSHNNKNQSDSEMENRRKSIILLFTVSGSFLLLCLTANVSFVITRMTNTTYYRADHASPAYLTTETGAMLKHLSSSTNTCIYTATQRKFREELKKVLKYPWALIARLSKMLQH
ncbi:probable G-protein coupled receptor 139 [Rhincodon typus]|uniref:probable G-protein coupled receptor 139 n=1 Tax=Rhincodon typus TaxID=259920 RepID=UPI002030F0C7|nr:probable G-protein coupled receptor 139 [Rhincodon typus]